ncbi:inorganic phosphate transporter [Acinetobacter nectaris]|uniref:inorganic phosphate transporter n=1 Tax=Acinetobacter nectaris TaxID=1219382 RepID=UPI001F024EE8|nr:inorganic phosphate transporter [Acinetobacter nectaris]MCF8999623.1 inorganic phosphate transporter [Acinetobacter nectaris]MCF9028177.1 inorganic phosphate transporter [Acinetobacter nectaris]
MQNTASIPNSKNASPSKNSNVNQPSPQWFKYSFLIVVIVSCAYIGLQLVTDLSTVPPLSSFSFFMLGLALLIALGFEFVNGFHDTANAVATVIYTNAMPAPIAVMWSGFFNFLGVLSASGAVAYGIIALLPVELILHVNSSAGFAMVFALLIAAIIWNLSTWLLGLPASSSHTMIGSILGVGLMNQILHSGFSSGLSGIDVEQVIKVIKALLVSPLVGFGLAAVAFLLLKLTLKNKNTELFDAPKSDKPPSFVTRLLLICTCTGVSFAHGSNDGQKGMGLIMLILIGIVPLAYSLNKTMDSSEVQAFAALSEKSAHILVSNPDQMDAATARNTLTQYIQTKHITPETTIAVAALSNHLGKLVADYKTMGDIPENTTINLRNDMYLSSTTLKAMQKNNQLTQLNAADTATITQYRKDLDQATQYIPTWVKVAVALALGLGTMVGWKRIVVTVGERIGKTHLTYSQGMSAEFVAMGTIIAADKFGLPVSTTHVLNSAVAGTMTANKSGLQWSTIKSIILAWVLTLPCAMILSATLYWLFSKFI